MLTVKIIWPSDFENYSVYTCKHYVLMALVDGTKSMILTRDHAIDTTEIILGPGTQAYVMNDNGATVDKINVLNLNPTAPISTNHPSGMWVNPRTGETTDRCGW